MVRCMNKFITGIMFLSMLLVVNVEADTITLNAIDSGWYSPKGEHFSGNQNYAVGGNSELRNFFVFDLLTVSGIITSAALQINSGGVGGSDTYTLYDVSTDIARLREDHNPQIPSPYAPDIYSDIGSGDVYGSIVIEERNWQMINVSMNSVATTAINSAVGGLFAIGGSYPVNTASYAFFSSGSNLNRRLILETEQVPVAPVPEPATIILMGAGVLGLIGASRKKAKRRG
jgi:hypothetical protein